MRRSHEEERDQSVRTQSNEERDKSGPTDY
jgi:hypothetical protein